MTDLSPIRKSLTVPLRPDDAFRLFTDGLPGWWPVETHSVSAGRKARPREVTVTPGPGGGITERTELGLLVHWATFTRWEPGARVAFDWYVGRSREEATEVEVTFTAVDTGTRVDLTHAGWDHAGETASARRESYVTGWDLVLGRYTQALVTA